MSFFVDIAPHAERTAAIAEKAGDREFAATIRRLGAAIDKLSFDDEALCGEVADRLREPPYIGEVSAALVASGLMLARQDPDMARHCLTALFDNRLDADDPSLVESEDVLTQLVCCAMSFDEHDEAFGWAFATLSPPVRARWAALLAAACWNVGDEAHGGWLEMASACIPDDTAFRTLVTTAYRDIGVKVPSAAFELVDR